MDLTDLRILQAMGIQFFGPRPLDRKDFRAPELAKRVGVDEKTVRARLARMQESGLLDGYDLFPNLRLFGLQEGVLYYFAMDPEEKETAFATLGKTRRVTLVHDFFKGPFCVVYAYPQEDPARRHEEIDALMGRKGEFVLEANPPQVPEAPSPLDWRIMAALRHEALLPAVELADRLGVTTRTIRRRLDRLADNHAYYVFPRLDPTKGDGLLFVSASAWPDAQDRASTVRRVREVVAPHRFLEVDAGEGVYYATLAVRSPTEAERIQRSLQRTEGVERAEVNLLQRAIDLSDWMDRELAERSGAEILPPQRP